MKQNILGLLLFILTPLLQAQTTGDAILGKWMNKDETKQMEIYKTGSAYFGKLIWIKPNDGNTKVKVGDVVLKDFFYADNKWKGTVLVKGDSYSATLKLSGSVLSITASVGFLSKTKEWIRING